MNHVCVSVTASFCSETRCTLKTHRHKLSTITLCRIYKTTCHHVHSIDGQHCLFQSHSRTLLLPMVHSHSHFAPSTARFHSHSVHSPTGLVPFPLCSQDSQVSFPFCSQSHWFSPIPYHYKYLITPVVVLHQQCKAKLMTSKLHNEWDSAVKKRMKINIKYTNALSMQLSFISAECSLNTLRQQQSSQFPCEFLTTFISSYHYTKMTDNSACFTYPDIQHEKSANHHSTHSA